MAKHLAPRHARTQSTDTGVSIKGLLGLLLLVALTWATVYGVVLVANAMAT